MNNPIYSTELVRTSDNRSADSDIAGRSNDVFTLKFEMSATGIGDSERNASLVVEPFIGRVDDSLRGVRDDVATTDTELQVAYRTTPKL